MPAHNKKPLSASGLTITKQMRTQYPTQLGVRDPSIGIVQYRWPLGVPSTDSNPWSRGWYPGWYKHDVIPKQKTLRPLLAKKGEYAWTWQDNRDMHPGNVGLVVVSGTRAQDKYIVTADHELVRGDELVRITKKQYLEVLTRHKTRKVLKRLGAVK